MSTTPLSATAHDHVFLGAGHERAERRTWAVIILCGAMMMLEIVGGLLFGSIALVADGLHMSTHAGALLLAALCWAIGPLPLLFSNHLFIKFDPLVTATHAIGWLSKLLLIAAVTALLIH